MIHSDNILSVSNAAPALSAERSPPILATTPANLPMQSQTQCRSTSWRAQVRNNMSLNEQQKEMKIESIEAWIYGMANGKYFSKLVAWRVPSFQVSFSCDILIVIIGDLVRPQVTEF